MHPAEPSQTAPGAMGPAKRTRVFARCSRVSRTRATSVLLPHGLLVKNDGGPQAPDSDPVSEAPARGMQRIVCESGVAERCNGYPAGD